MILYVIIKIMKNVFYVPIWNNLKDVLYSDKSKIHKNKHSMLPHVKKRNTFFVLFTLLPYACITFKK